MILEIKNLSKNFGGIKAVNKCNMEVKKGKITAIIGPNGSGKSTLFNLVSKLMKANKGRVLFDKRNIMKLRPFEVSKLGLSRTFQDVRLFRNLTIREHLEIAMSQTDESLIKSVFGKKRNNIKKIKEILKLVELHKPLNTYGSDLSYGQRKLLDLAVGIAKPHHLLMLDEPVAGVNPKLREKIKKVIKKLNKQGETILVIEHDMNFVMDLADRVFVLDVGKVIAEGTPKQIQRNKHVLEAYLGD